MSPKSFAIRIFLADGTADGVKIIAKSKWSGRCMVIPRKLFARESGREELDAPGIYLLVGEGGTANGPTLFIGAADPVSKRVAQHDSAQEGWSLAVTFTSKKASLKPAVVHYLQARLLQLACETRRAELYNQTCTEFPQLDAEELAEADQFLGHLLSICPLLGVTAFEPGES